MNCKGWLKLDRNILDWEWYHDLNVKVVFLHCLLRANFEPQKFEGKVIPPGSFVTSYEHLANECDLTIQKIRTALNKLKSTCEITYKSTSRYSIITVNNWDKWQSNQQSEQLSNNKQITTIKEYKNIRNNNISLSNRERALLNNYVIRNKLAKSNINAYVSTLIRNGDYKYILEQEEHRLKRLEENKAVQPQEEYKVTEEDNKRGRELLDELGKKLRRGTR